MTQMDRWMKQAMDRRQEETLRAIDARTRTCIECGAPVPVMSDAHLCKSCRALARKRAARRKAKQMEMAL